MIQYPSPKSKDDPVDESVTRVTTKRSYVGQKMVDWDLMGDGERVHFECENPYEEQSEKSRGVVLFCENQKYLIWISVVQKVHPKVHKKPSHC